MWHVLNAKDFNPKYMKRFPRSQIIGTPSKNGVVRRVEYKGNPVKFVSKEIPKTKLSIFKKEIYVGQLPHVEKFGPRVVAYRILSDRCEYIMDNFIRGHKDLHVLTLDQYKKKIGIVPFMIWKMFYKSLLSFYKVTHGYHGDLHTNNIAIIFKKSKPIQVQIYDYGTWRPFTSQIPKNSSLLNYLSYERASPKNKQIRPGVYAPSNDGQLYRRNINTLQSAALRAFYKINTY